jgi:hypothetical protein
MISEVNTAAIPVADSASLSTPATPAALDSVDSFAQQLVSALQSYLGNSGTASQLDISIQKSPSQNSNSGQYIVTLNPQPPATSGAASGADVPATTPATPVFTSSTAVSSDSSLGSDGNPVASTPSLSALFQSFENDWSVLTPQQVAFQLANAAGSGGGMPNEAVPGTSMTYGQLTQSQQIALQYAQDSGTGGVSMQDFLTQNAGPPTAWNISYNQAQSIAAIQAQVDPSYQIIADGSPSVIQAPLNTTPDAVSGNEYNLPNPAMIQYLPPDQQAAALAALAAEGSYGENAATAAAEYA